MKKILVCLALLLSLSISTYSQDYVRIGREKNEVIKEFKGYKTTMVIDKNHTTVMVVNINGNEIIYSFDSDGYCVHTSVISKDFDTAKRYQDFYILKYTRINGGVNEIIGDITYSVFLNCDKHYVFSFRYKY